MMKQARTAPMFKPLSGTENTSLFNFESHSNNARSVRQVPIMNINEQCRQTQQHEVGAERLSSLHAKLHQEADKIRKWKVQTEIELKQKEKKIHEASTTNESLRKSILELQLQNENLSLKLQEEMGNREDVIQRISSTRQLCNILKDHAVKLEEQLHQCETERTELKYLEKEHLQQFEELSEQFNKLRITSVEQQNKLVDQLQLEREDRRTLEETLESKLNEAELQLKALLDQCDEKDIEIRDVRTMLQRNDEKIHSLEQNIASLQEQREHHVTDIQTKDTSLEEASEKLFQAEKEKICYEEKLSEISSQLENLKIEKSCVEQNMALSSAEYDEKLSNLQQQHTDLTASLHRETEKVKQYEAQLSEMSTLSENLKSSRDILMLEKNELEGKVALLSKEISANNQTIHQHIEAFSSLTNQHASLKAELSKSMEDTEHLLGVVESEKQKFNQRDSEYQALCDKLTAVEVSLKQTEDISQSASAKIEELQNELQMATATNNELQIMLDKERDKLESSTNMIADMKKEMASKVKEITSLETSMNKLKKDQEKVQKEKKNLKDENNVLGTNLEKAEEDKQDLLQKIRELEEQIEHLKEEQNEQDKSVDSTMKTKSKQISDLETKVKDQKGEIISKNKQVKELEKEIKTLKSKLTTSTKAADCKEGEIGEMREQMESLTTLNEKLQSDVEKLTQQIDKLKESEKTARQKMEEMQASHDQSLMQKLETEKKCEYELAQMMAMMEKYKNENNKIVQQKEKEIEQLKTKSMEFTSKKHMRDGHLEEMKQASEEIKASLDAAIAEKNELETKLSSQTQTVDKLAKTISSKDAEIKDLKENTKLLKKQLKAKPKQSAIHTQTSPASSPVKMSVTPKISRPDETSDSSPQNLKTPQRSILRNTNSVSKRRKVAFASHDDSGRHSASDSDSSTELMEVELESVNSRYKSSNTKSTPLLIRPSPKVRSSPKPVTPNRRIETTEKTPVQLTRIPRGPPVKLCDRKQKPHGESVMKDEREMFKGLFPNKQYSTLNNKENKQKSKEDETCHLRKTPSKSTAKFFKASPKERLSKKAKHAGTDEIAWFDLDSVFGFGPED